MNYMKKFLSLLFALALLTALAPTAFAGQTPDNPPAGTITVKNAEVGQTYNIYQILVLESYNTSLGAYTYKVADDWEAFLNSAEIKDVFLHIDDEGRATWVEGADPAAFAKLAREAAAGIGSQDSITADKAVITFDVPSLGYYLVDSTLGALCSLDTTNPDMTIKDKNNKPTVDKTVKEDSTGSYGGENDADIGQTVEFQTVIHARKGAQNYVLHDQMDAGLMPDPDSVAVAGAVKDTDYTVTSSALADGCAFEVTFAQSYLDTITEDKDITVSYSATLNGEAVIGGDGNINKTKLDYGVGNSTEWDTTVTYTWEIDILKYGGDDETKVLKDAKFVLLNSKKTKAAVFADGKVTGWIDVPAGADSDGWPAEAVLITGEDGKIAIEGLDADTYYLREIKAPVGYARLLEDTPVTVSASTDATTGVMTQIPVTAKISNKVGSKLPTTGGMGTTIFYIVGTVLIVAAGILLVIKKKRK